MTPQDNKSWSEEFDEKFSHTETCRGLRFEQSSDQKLECFCSLKDIKSFVHSTLNKERGKYLNELQKLDNQKYEGAKEEERNRLIEKVEKAKDKLEKEDDKKVNGMWLLGGIEALSDILTILKEDGKN